MYNKIVLEANFSSTDVCALAACRLRKKEQLFCGFCFCVCALS